MIDVTIKAETQLVADTLKMFLTTYKEQTVGFINQVLSSNGTPVDAGVQVIDDTIVVYQLNPDKGFVLGEITQELPTQLPVTLMNYTALPVGNRYITIEGDRIFLYIKEEEGTPDGKLGAFKALNDAVKEFNSESVKTAMQNYKDKRAAEDKAQAKTARRLEKLGKLPAAVNEAEMTPMEEESNG